MTDGRLTRQRYVIEGLIVLIVVVAAIIGFIIRAKDAPLASAAAEPARAAVARVTRLDNVSLRAEQPLFSLDIVSVNGKILSVSSVKDIRVRATDAISVSGWTADRVVGIPANAVFVAIGSAKPIALQYGGARPDVAKALGNPKLENTGFTGKLQQQVLPSGSLPLRFFVVDSTGSSYDEVQSPISLTVK